MTLLRGRDGATSRLREMILSWVLGNVSLDWCAFRTKVPHAARQATTCSQAQSNRHMDVTMSVLS